MFGWSSVATVAAQPPNHVGKAAKPFEEMTAPGMGALLTSVVRRVLKGLYAAELFVDPPSAACHSSRSSTFACVAGAVTPCSTHSSQPAGRTVSPGAATILGAAAAVDASAQTPRLAMVRTSAARTHEMKRGMRCFKRFAPRPRGARSRRGLGRERDRRTTQGWHVSLRGRISTYRQSGVVLEPTRPFLDARCAVRAAELRIHRLPRPGPGWRELCDLPVNGSRPERARSPGPAHRALGAATARRGYTSRSASSPR